MRHENILKISKSIGWVIGYIIIYPIYTIINFIYGKDVLLDTNEKVINKLKNLNKRA